MKFADGSLKQNDMQTQIVEFISRTSGLKVQPSGDKNFNVVQLTDGKSIQVARENLDEVLFRSDSDGRDFIQVNFVSGQKVLMTDTLIGFKPARLNGVDMSRLPKVVTTPDLISIFDAIQDCLDVSESPDEEVQMLRRVFESVLSGGEAAGFNLTVERSYLVRLSSVLHRVNA